MPPKQMARKASMAAFTGKAAVKLRNSSRALGSAANKVNQNKVDPCDIKPRSHQDLDVHPRRLARGSLHKLHITNRQFVCVICDGTSCEASWMHIQILDDDDTFNNLEENDGGSTTDHEHGLNIILTAQDPNVPDNLVIFNYKEMCFKKDVETLPLFVHFSLSSYVKNIEDEIDKDNDTTSNAIKEDKLRNQFNFSERSTQTIVNSYKTKKVQTQLPQQANFSANALQWEIYEFYTKDAENQEKVKDTEKGLAEKTAELSNYAVPRSKIEAKKINTSNLLTTLCIMERIVNQNTYDEIAQDFQYWEDLSDEFKNGNGSLLPLWKFFYDDVKRLTVTSLQWTLKYDDVFVASFGSYNFMNQRTGLICIYSLCNPTHPEYTFPAPTGVMSVAVHPKYFYLLVAGFYDGNVAIYNVQLQGRTPLCQSSASREKHSDVVWQVQWHDDDTNGNQNFHSISADGRLIHWTIVKNILRMSEVLALNLQDPISEELNLPILTMPACGTTFAFHPQWPSVFLIGTREGRIYSCNKAYSQGIQQEYEKHQQTVYRMHWNEFYPSVFASCSADGTVKIWDYRQKEPVCTYNMQSPVGDIQWAPYSSTVFAAVTSDGKVYIYDVHVKKYHPICVQKVAPKKGTQLTSISFNRIHPIILVGDDKLKYGVPIFH